MFNPQDYYRLKYMATRGFFTPESQVESMSEDVKENPMSMPEFINVNKQQQQSKRVPRRPTLVGRLPKSRSLYGT